MRKLVIICVVVLLNLLASPLYASRTNTSGSQLLVAARSGDVAAVQKALRQKADINVKGPDGWTPLMWAAVTGHVEVVRLLLDSGAEVNVAAKKSGDTALILAALKGHTEVVRLLLSKNALVELKHKAGWTALWSAAANGHAKAIELLSEKGADVNTRDNNGFSPLMVACVGGPTDSVKLLVDKGALVDLRDRSGATALMFAAAKGHSEAVKLLLLKGADVSLTDNRGRTALAVAMSLRHGEVVKLLSDYQTRPKRALSRDRDEAEKENSSLVEDCRLGNLDRVQDKLATGADVNARDGDGDTSLIVAATEGKLDIVRLLLQNGANVNGWGYGLRTALFVASYGGHAEVVKLLLESGADVNAKNQKGWTALDGANYKGHKHVVDLLIAFVAKQDGRIEGTTVAREEEKLINLTRSQEGEPYTSTSARKEEEPKLAPQAPVDTGVDTNTRTKSEGTAPSFTSRPGPQENSTPLSSDKRGEIITPEKKAPRVPDAPKKPPSRMPDPGSNSWVLVILFLVIVAYVLYRARRQSQICRETSPKKVYGQYPSTPPLPKAPQSELQRSQHNEGKNAPSKSAIAEFTIASPAESKAVPTSIPRRDTVTTSSTSPLYQKVIQRGDHTEEIGQPGHVPAEVTVVEPIGKSGTESKTTPIPSRAANPPIQIKKAATEPASQRIALEIKIETSFTSGAKAFVQKANRLVAYRESNAKPEPFMCYWPTYDSMNTPQQRWYFYWRGEVSEGHYPDTDLSYVFVHVYELINNVGVTSPLDGYEQLHRLWLSYRARYPKLDKYLIDWIYDYIGINNCPINALEFLSEAVKLGCHISEPDLVLPTYISGNLDELPKSLLASYIDYRVLDSKFYLAGNEELIDKYFPKTIAHINNYMLNQNGKGIFEVFRPEIMQPALQRAPFLSAIFLNDGHVVQIPARIPYSGHQPLREFLTAILKCIENRLRVITNFKGRVVELSLPADTRKVIEDFIGSFETKISPPPPPPVVNIDFSKASQLSKDSAEVRYMLLNSAEIASQDGHPHYVRLHDSESGETGLPAGPLDNAISALDSIPALLSQITNEERKVVQAIIEADGVIANSLLKEQLRETFVEPLVERINELALELSGDLLIISEGGFKTIPDNFRHKLEPLLTVEHKKNQASDWDDAVCGLPNAWKSLGAKLSDEQVLILQAIVSGSDVSKKLQRISAQKASMPQLLIDELNELAMDAVGDLIIVPGSTCPIIQEEHSHLVTQLLKLREANQ
ncbi:MAG: TerB N-terminal domain-containing protein [Desulfomonilaceae bacterium]